MRQSQRLAQQRAAADSTSSRCDTPADSAGTSTRTHSFGSAGDNIDEDVKAVMVRAVQGMKVQEAARFKQHLRAMQAKWQADAERHAEQLQSVILQYQVRATMHCPRVALDFGYDASCGLLRKLQGTGHSSMALAFSATGCPWQLNVRPGNLKWFCSPRTSRF
jgi:hypothetical protein